MEKLKYWGKLLLISILPFAYIATELKKEGKERKYIIITTCISFFVFCIFWNAVFSDSTTELENKIIEHENQITTKENEIAEYRKANSEFSDEVQDYQQENEKLKVDLKNAIDYGKLTDAEKAEIKKKEEAKRLEEEKVKEEARKQAVKDAEETEKKMKEKANKEEYEKWIKEQFSVWDGSCKKIKDMTIQSLNDPDSFKHISTKYWEQADMKSIIISMEFTAKNGFGGTIRSIAKGTLSRSDGTITNFEILN